jgi:plasmid stabilization system protein ParE
MNLVWTKKASASFQQVIGYLEQEFSQKEVDTFITDVYSIIAGIQSFPKMYPQSKQLKKVHKATVSKQCSLFYTQSKDTITLLLFWDNRRNPSSLDL